MDQIEIKGIAAFGYHGVLPQEREVGQRFYADITLETDMTAIGRSDEITDGVNYAEVYRTAQAILTGAPVNTLEALVTNINAAILRAYPLVSAVTTTVYKPSAPVPGPLTHVAVTRREER